MQSCSLGLRGSTSSQPLFKFPAGVPGDGPEERARSRRGGLGRAGVAERWRLLTQTSKSRGVWESFKSKAVVWLRGVSFHRAPGHAEKGMLGENRGGEREEKKKREGGMDVKWRGGQIMLSILPFVAQPAVFIHHYLREIAQGWTLFFPPLLTFFPLAACHL